MSTLMGLSRRLLRSIVGESAIVAAAPAAAARPPAGERPIADSSADAGTRPRAANEAWSRPRKIAVLLREYGHDVPSRLHRGRFQALIAELAAEGFEACLADDPDYVPLGPDEESPGINGMLRIRKIQRVVPLKPAVQALAAR